MRGSSVSVKVYTRNLALIVPALALIVLSVSQADAQSLIPSKLDLETAIEKALADNPQTRISTTKLKIADAKIAAAKSGKLPSAQFTQSAVGSNNPVFVFGSLLEQGRFGPSNFAIDSLNNPSGLVNMRTLVGAQVPIFDQRQTRSRVTQAETSKKQTELQAELVRQNLRFEVIRTYYGAVLGKELLKVSQEAVLSARANRKKTGDMVRVGMTTEADSLAADVELANADQQVLTVKRLRFADDEPLMIEMVHLPAQIVPGLVPLDLEDGILMKS
jgi:outer membrane protein TolC